ncbi:hypothetical protein I4U23_017950 [Adineta vaga]|nr:hypothetical protein I4U23_017950 [Adineta vaga]
MMSTFSDIQRIQNAIKTNLSKITNYTSDLETLVKKLDTSEDSPQLRDRYLHLQNEIKTLIQQTNHTLEQLQTASIKTDDERRQKEALTQTLSKQYMKSITRFQELQRLASFQRQSMHDSQGVDNVAFTNSPSGPQIALSMDQDTDLKALQERDSQLRQLETNIVEVNELFKDISKIVHEHGEIIDVIENNIVETETHVDTGNRQLKQAVTYQSAARRKKFLLILILVIVIAIIALVLGIYFGVAKK